MCVCDCVVVLGGDTFSGCFKGKPKGTHPKMGGVPFIGSRWAPTNKLAVWGASSMLTACSIALPILAYSENKTSQIRRPSASRPSLLQRGPAWDATGSDWNQ